MIVKFIKNNGGGSAKASMDYLLGKDRNREGARLLAGDPELTQKLSDSLKFENRYTVGVLSFEENNLPDEKKRAIMESFESSLLAGLEKEQYNITWVEHTDKDRLELNFVIANQELTTGKRLQPYYDKADRPLVENWKQVINYEYGLTDPHDPTKAQALKTLNRQNLPKNVKQIKEQIGQAIAEQIELGNITNRNDVIETLEQAGFEIARQTEKSISIKNPDGKRNIRLEGVIYENRQLGKELGKDYQRARQDYAETSGDRYQTASAKLRRAIEIKQGKNRTSFSREREAHQRISKPHTASYDKQNDDRGIDGRIRSNNIDTFDSHCMVGREREEQQSGISTDTAEHRAITNTSESTGTSGDSGTGWSDLYSDQRRRKGGELREQDQSRIENQIRLEHERLFDTLQRTSGRTGSQAEQTRNTDRAIDSSQSSVERTKRAITSTDREIANTEQQAQQFVEANRQAEKVVSHSSGMER